MRLQQQTDVLVRKRYPALLGRTEAAFRELTDTLAEVTPAEPFVLVVARSLLPPEVAVARTDLAGRAGFTTMDPADLARFAPAPNVAMPAAAIYLLTDVDTGAGTRGVRPDDALPLLLAQGRTPLTLEEGLAVATQHPEWLWDHGFQMLGSRCGDKRVLGLWLSGKAPRLGWCWGGNPHSWLGMASAVRRIAPLPADYPCSPGSSAA